MVKNKHIQVVNENGTSVVLSGAIIVEYLKDYTSDWGSISTSANLAEIESEFAPSDLENPENKANIDVFNGKIGFVLPKITLNSLINEVIVILRREDIKYLTIFQSFNNLEKVAMYFILIIQSSRTVSEIFDMINSNYRDISKRDIMIKLLSEVDIVESDVDITDPINGFYKFLSSVPTHGIKPKPSFEIASGEIEFKEFTFPMHSYNTTKVFSEISDVNESNDSVRNYYDRFKATWKANQNNSKVLGWFGDGSPLFIRTYWKDVLKDSIFSQISTVADEGKRDISSYRGILDQLAWRNIYFHKVNERPLFKHLGENFFDFNPNSSSTDDQTSRSPLTMTKFSSSESNTVNYFTRANLTTGSISYNLSDFKNFKTLLSYYMSDLNIWLTSDFDATNYALTDYLHVQGITGFLTSNAKCETKGYFSNIMFIQSAIQRILYPIILKAAQGGYGDNPYSLNDIFRTNDKIYDSIFDSIVNNSFVYTDRLNNTTDFENNYEIIPNRAILQTPNPNTDLINYKATNLYEFIINSLVYSKNDVISGSFRKVIDSDRIKLFTRQDLLYKNNAINYNPIDNQMSSTATSLTVNDFDTESITYDFGTNYDPTENNWFDKIVSNFFRMDGNTESYSKINYRNMKFFKIPIHSANTTFRNNMNRYIRRADRELLTDISDLANFDIKGLSLADFTYGEKALLKEYIENFRSIRLSNGSYSDLEVIEEMIKDLDSLMAWKINPSNVALNNPSNIYYRISELANTRPSAGIQYDYYRWLAMAALKKTIYFPELLSIASINSIKELLNRAILKINRSRNTSRNSSFISELKRFVSYSAIDIDWVNTLAPSSSNRLELSSVGTYFLNALKLIVSHIRETTQYSEKFDLFSTAYQTGVWNDILVQIEAIRDVLLDDTLIQNTLSVNKLYGGYYSGILKDLDLGLYKLTINNYFSYLMDPNTLPQPNLMRTILRDNNENGIIKYYSDLLTLLSFVDKYNKFIPEYVKYLNDNVLDKYYYKINAIKALPSWDYESLHRRGLEKDLKNSGGINSRDYNITWGNNNGNIVMIYKTLGSFSDSYKVTPSLYKGGLSNVELNNEHRDRWWRRWLTDTGEAFSETNIKAFKVPYVDVKDNNIEFPATWEYNNPADWSKLNSFEDMKFDVGTYQSGLVANITSFKYTTDDNKVYSNIGVPLLLLGDDGSEWNKANTVRTNSFSFETDFLNLWHTDEKYDDGLSHNNGGGEAYTWGYQLVSGADKFKKFGLGKMDIQEMFRHFWNMESSPMATPYNAMAYFIFDEWDEGYDYEAGNFPYATVIDHKSFLSTTDTQKKSNKYDFKFVLQNSFLEGMWSPIRLSGEDRSIGVDPDITSDQINKNFYLESTSTVLRSNTDLKNAIFDIYNRNFRNRVYLSYLRWRYFYNLGAW